MYLSVFFYKGIFYMKSVVAQSSTLAKAVEEAWNKAGRPEEFFIKILEEPTNGFLGFRAKKAKVGLFFKSLDKKEDALVPQVLKQKEYTSFFNNDDLVVDSEIVEQKKQSVQKVQPRRSAEQPVEQKQINQRQTVGKSRQQQPRQESRAAGQEKNQPVQQKQSAPRSLPQRPLPQKQVQTKQQEEKHHFSETIITESLADQVMQAPKAPRKRYYRRNNYRKKNADGVAKSASESSRNSGD